MSSIATGGGGVLGNDVEERLSDENVIGNGSLMVGSVMLEGTCWMARGGRVGRSLGMTGQAKTN
jgi:hypothetical protein